MVGITLSACIKWKKSRSERFSKSVVRHVYWIITKKKKKKFKTLITEPANWRVSINVCLFRIIYSQRDRQIDRPSLIIIIIIIFFFFLFVCLFLLEICIDCKTIFISVSNRFQYSISWKSVQKCNVLVLNGIKYLLYLSLSLSLCA